MNIFTTDDPKLPRATLMKIGSEIRSYYAFADALDGHRLPRRLAELLDTLKEQHG